MIEQINTTYCRVDVFSFQKMNIKYLFKFDSLNNNDFNKQISMVGTAFNSCDCYGC